MRQPFRCGVAFMKIRSFQNSDLNAIAGIYSLSKLDELRYEAAQFELLPLEQDAKRLQETMESRIFVYDDGGVLGYGAVRADEVRALFVHPVSRGKGVGRRLFEHLLSEVDSPARLYVAKSNVPAKTMYLQYGFTITKEFETSYNGQPVLANEMVCVTRHT
ncbi:MAG: GNAT family N-acetyltransferase [Natronospirillum sp.]